jgi:hypothetical protein
MCFKLRLNACCKRGLVNPCQRARALTCRRSCSCQRSRRSRRSRPCRRWRCWRTVAGRNERGGGRRGRWRRGGGAAAVRREALGGPGRAPGDACARQDGHDQPEASLYQGGNQAGRPPYMRLAHLEAGVGGHQGAVGLGDLVAQLAESRGVGLAGRLGHRLGGPGGAAAGTGSLGAGNLGVCVGSGQQGGRGEAKGGPGVVSCQGWLRGWVP